jgi:hypothetical protein
MGNPTNGPRPRASASLVHRLLALFVVSVLVAACAAASTPGALAPVGERPGDGTSGGFDQSGSGGAGPFPTAAPSAPGAPNAAPAPQKIAWTGRLQLQVADLDASLSTAQAAINGLGGFVSASRRSGGDRPVASVTYRIPSDR